MDPSYLNSDLGAYKKAVYSFEKNPDEDLNFEGIVLPALRFLKENASKAEPDLLIYIFTHISDSSTVLPKSKICLLFLTQFKLTESQTVNLLITLLRRSKTDFALDVLCSYKGPLSEENGVLLAKFSVEQEAIAILDFLCQKQKGIIETALVYAFNRDKQDSVHELMGKNHSWDFSELSNLVSALITEKRLTILNQAIQQGCAPLVDVLLTKYPELLDIKNEQGKTVLQEVLLLDRKELSLNRAPIAVLVQAFRLGIVKNPLDSSWITIIEESVSCELELARGLSKKTLEILNEILNEHKLRLIVAHAYSIEDTEQFAYEGMVIEYTTFCEKSMGERLVHLPQEVGGVKEMEILEKAFLGVEEIYKIFQKKESLLGVVKKIQEGELIILPTGYKEHHVDVVFFNGLMVICNRGPRPKLSKTIEAFRIDPTKITEADVVRILAKKSSIKDKENLEQGDKTLFLFEIAKNLSDKGELVQDDLCKLLQDISPKEQSVGNCSYTSSKTALRASLALLRVSLKPKEEWSHLLSNVKQDSKKITTALRLEFLEKYLHHQESAHWVRGLKDEYLLARAVESLKKRRKKYPISIDSYPRVKILLQRD